MGKSFILQAAKHNYYQEHCLRILLRLFYSRNLYQKGISQLPKGKQHIP